MPIVVECFQRLLDVLLRDLDIARARPEGAYKNQVDHLQLYPPASPRRRRAMAGRSPSATWSTLFPCN